MADKSAVHERLWHSLEMHCLRRDLIMILVAMVLSVLIYWGNQVGWLSIVLTGIVFGPFLVFYLWRGFQIFRKPEGYVFYRTTLSRFQQKFPLKSMYFTVELEEPDGSKRMENTHAIFSCHGIVEPLVGSYVNSAVTIGLNKKTGMVVVIG